MTWQQMILDGYQNMFQEIDKVLDGLTVSDLKQRPSAGANPIGWLCWHAVRSCDRLLGDIVLGQQLWIVERWHEKFRCPADLNDTGRGHTDAQVDALYFDDVQLLLDYSHAVQKPLIIYLSGSIEQELEKEYPSSLIPGATRPVYPRLIGVLGHNNQYVGQAAYVRGLIKGHGWYGR